MRGGLHKVCYDGAGDDAGESGQKGAGEGVSGFLDFGGYVVDAEGVEDGFGAAEDEGGGQADGGVGAVLFVEVEEETGGGAGGEHFYDGEGNQGGGKPVGFRRFSRRDARASRKPEARRIPTPVIRPINVGMILPLFSNRRKHR